MSTELCWEQKYNGKTCRNYKKNGYSKCRYHISSYNLKSILTFITFVTIFSYLYYLNKYEYNMYYYRIMNDLCKNLSKIELNVCFYLENYKEIHKEIYKLAKQQVTIKYKENVEIYIKKYLIIYSNIYKYYFEFKK